MKAHYIRVSTEEQNTARQEVKGILTFIDKCSGSIAFKERIEAKKLLKEIDIGNIKEISVSSIDRLGRNTLDIMQTIEYLTAKGINVVSEKEGLNTIINGKENPISKMLVGILGTLAEFELSRIKERQTEGIAKAKEKGIYVGRSGGSKEDIEVFLNKAKTKDIIKHLKNKESVRRAAKLSSSSISLVQKVKGLLTI
jgi:DNA invertase Pin-like site-specific DNA recombinase